MISIKTPLGSVILTNEYFSNLVGNITAESYGVKGMSSRTPIEGFWSKIIKKDLPNKGVKVTEKGKELIIDIHIKVVYGVNISAIVKSISEKVKYTVEQSTALRVKAINVYVDEMVSGTDQ
jgi:uncharacterized alkaline shock family protein YloU